MFLLSCAVCGFGEDPSQWAYLAMTLVLSAVPLGMIAAGWYWVVKKMGEAEKAASLLPGQKTSR